MKERGEGVRRVLGHVEDVGTASNASRMGRKKVRLVTSKASALQAMKAGWGGRAIGAGHYKQW